MCCWVDSTPNKIIIIIFLIEKAANKQMSALSDNLRIPVDQLPNHIIQEQLESDKVEGETEDAKLKEHQVLQHYNVTMNDLEELEEINP
jgi:hypothetical protein